MYVAHVAEAAATHEVVRAVAAARITAFGWRMCQRSAARRNAALSPLQVGDAVRVSFTVLPHVRRLAKGALHEPPLPSWSSDTFTITRAARHHDRPVYDVACATCGDAGGDPRPARVHGMLAQLAPRIAAVDRRLLRRIPAGNPLPSMGRELGGVTPALWAAPAAETA